MKFNVVRKLLQLLIVEKLTGFADHKVNLARTFKNENGKIGWALLWLIGVPLPLLLVLYFFFGN